ncbi:hypothetical protein N7532_008877 [Penicillium argentinense]|uniref:Uncharacterized protein n=1 Tax=Penicillium argentinense TaxID=1131581 RepID=A0A9W9K231_9EURO|nr:uncharacterized protein N7532_008877 [Penicillium argentinense]KAJ5090193.1 hypothetical protein N7532_008877 [Penicillium argentinense]
MSSGNTYGGAPPTGYTGGPPPALRPGGYVSRSVQDSTSWQKTGVDTQQQQQQQQQPPQQYQAYPGTPPPQGAAPGSVSFLSQHPS